MRAITKQFVYLTYETHKTLWFVIIKDTANTIAHIMHLLLITDAIAFVSGLCARFDCISLALR